MKSLNGQPERAQLANLIGLAEDFNTLERARLGRNLSEARVILVCIEDREDSSTA